MSRDRKYYRENELGTVYATRTIPERRAVIGWEQAAQPTLGLYTVRRRVSSPALTQNLLNIFVNFKKDVEPRAFNLGVTLITRSDYISILQRVPDPDLVESVAGAFVGNILASPVTNARLGKVMVLGARGEEKGLRYIAYGLEDRDASRLVHERSRFFGQGFGMQDNATKEAYPHITVAVTESEQTALRVARVLCNREMEGMSIDLDQGRFIRSIGV